MLCRKFTEKIAEKKLLRFIFPRVLPPAGNRRPAIGALLARRVFGASARQALTDLPAARAPFWMPPLRLPSFRAAVEAFLDAAGRNPFVRRWRQWRWCAAVVLLALLLGAVCSSNVIIAKASPLLAVSNAASGTLADLGDRFEASPLVLLRRLAVSAQYGEISADFDYRGAGGPPVSGDIRLLCDGLGKDFAALTTLSRGSSTESYEAYLSRNRLAFKVPQTDSALYGITFDTYDHDIATFAGASGLSDASVKTMTDLVHYLKTAIRMNSAEANEKYSRILGAFAKDLDPAMSREDIVLGEKSVSCSAVTFTLPESTVKKLARDLYDVYRENYALMPSPASLTSFYGDLTGRGVSSDTTEPLVPVERLDALMNRFETSYRGPLTVTCDISGSKLVRCVLSADIAADGGKAVVTADFGLNPKTDDLTLTVTTDAAGSGAVLFDLTVQTDNDPLYNANRITVRLGGDDKPAVVKALWLKKSGDLTVGIDGFGINYTARGALKLSEGTAELSFGDLLGGSSHLALTLAAQKGVTVPNPDYINLDHWDSVLQTS